MNESIKYKLKNLATVSVVAIKRKPLKEPYVQIKVKTKNRTGYYDLRVDDAVDIL